MSHFPLASQIYILLRRTILCLALLLLGPMSTVDGQESPDSAANEPDSNQAVSDEEQDALLTLLQLMETDIATKTQTLDPDFSPGIVSVLRGSDLEARGAKTVGDALSLIPGVYIPTAAFSELPVIRGIGGKFTEGSGKLKVLLNGVSFNNNLAAGSRALHQIPLALIDRIEFIRGPGSSVYGEYAYSGVVNLITHDGNGAYLEGGSFSSVGAGVLVSHDQGDLHLSLAVAAANSDGDDTPSGPDIIGTVFRQPQFSNAPGPANNSRDNTTASLGLEYKGFDLKLQLLDSGAGDSFGVFDALAKPSKRTVFTDEYLMLEGVKELEINPTFDLRIKLGWQQYENDFDRVEGLPAGALGLPDGTFANSSYQEDRFYGGVELESSRLSRQTWLLGVDYSDIATSNVVVTNNLVPGPIDVGYNDRDREVTGIYLQNYIEANDKWTFTIGMRADDYSDIGNSFNPRLAAVYRPSDKHAFKAQFAEAFRPPNFVELYNTTETLQGNPDIQPETIRTTELAYVYKTSNTVFRATAYNSKLDDLITREQMFTPLGILTLVNNSGGADLQGLEVEFDRQLSQKLRLDANLSLIDTKDRISQASTPGTADLLANIAWIYQPMERLVVTLQSQHMGARSRESFDLRPDLESQTVHHLTLSSFDLGSQGLTLRAGVRNLTEETTFDPAPAFTYPGDYPREGRSFWLRVAKEFKRHK